MCCGGGGVVSRLGATAGLLSLISVVGAVLTGGWLYTREPLTLPGSRIKSCCVTFKIGLWRVCGSLKRVLSTPLSPPNTLLPIPGCQLVPYSGWREVGEADLGITWSTLEFTPTFVTKMRYSTPFVALATVILGIGTLLAFMGHCYDDLKSLAASGFFTVGGLVLACGLVVFASGLSDVAVAAESDRHRRSHLEHRYGSSFHAAAAACVLSQLAAMLSVVAFLRRFATVEDMVRAVVPGGDRRLPARDALVLTPLPRPRYTTVIHQGLLGVAEGSTSSGSSLSCSSHSIPRHHIQSVDNVPLPHTRRENRNHKSFFLPHTRRENRNHKSFSLPRRHPLRTLESLSSDSQNT